MDIQEEQSHASVFGRLDVTISDTSLEAGRISPVTILVRNPFDVPVEIVEIQGPQSSQLREVPTPTEIGDESGSVEEGRETPIVMFPERKTGVFRSLVDSFLGQLKVSEVSVAGIKVDFPRTERLLKIHADPESEVFIDTDFPEFDTVHVFASDKATVKFRRQEQPKKAEKPSTPSKDKSFLIEPHCEVIAYFFISTTGWLFFTPTRKALSTQIRYRVEGRERTEVTATEFEFKPPLSAAVIGASTGAILGSLARLFNGAPLTLSLMTMTTVGGSVLMSLIAAIALSRKTGTQGFITVEDFFGGFVVGALIGYGGSEYFEQALLPEQGGG